MTIGQAYATLGLDASSATPDAARTRFRDLIRSNHPDGKPTHEQALANEKTRTLIEACTLLRLNGFLSSACGGRGQVGSSRLGRVPATGREPVDPFAWLDDVWRECVRGNVAGLASPLVSVGLVWHAWAVGCALLYGRRRN